MATLPLHDQAGNALVDFRVIEESDLPDADGPISLPASLVVVTFGHAVLTIFDRWRREWELPGGMREPGETARQAAIRELSEETGIHTTDLAFAALAECDLRSPSRREYLAVYRTGLRLAPRLVVNAEAADFRWWDPRLPPFDGLNPLDAEIARRVTSA
jgi:8-oxo-dGTP pyrophosphatase MutT (NUDIX family)